MMNAWLMVVAWGAGVASVFLVADMIWTDLACRRAERATTAIRRLRL
ncbi:MAG: hypothetical protein ACREFQ_19515 [Stellaceae bacterium]